MHMTGNKTCREVFSQLGSRRLEKEMGIKINAIKNYFEEIAPQFLAEEWDNVGLILGSMNIEINRVLVCLDVTRAAAEEAVRLKANMIISHHPIIFKGMKIIDENEPKGAVIYTLIKNNISVFCAHTNLDVADLGVNEELAKCIGLINLKNLRNYKTDKNTGKTYAMGKFGELENSLSLPAFIAFVKNKLSAGNVRLVGSLDREVKTVAVFCGSFDEDYSGFLKSNADVLLTGDLKYHVASDMKEMGLCVIDAGHFNTEKVIIPSLVKRLNKTFPQTEFIASSMEADPFIFT